MKQIGRNCRVKNIYQVPVQFFHEIILKMRRKILFLYFWSIPVSYSCLTSPELAKSKYTRTIYTETLFYLFDLFLTSCTILSQLQTTFAQLIRKSSCATYKNEAQSLLRQVTHRLLTVEYERKFTRVEFFTWSLVFCAARFACNLVVESRERSAGGR